MAEPGNQHLEHGLSELDEMGRIGLFSLDEITILTKKTKFFERRLQRTKTKENFLEYIDFESSLLLLINKKRKRLLCKAKKKEIDKPIAKKINSLYEAMISIYPEDEQLWLKQIEHLKRMKWNDAISALYTKLLEVHSKSPDLWILAAKWESDENQSFNNARKMLQRGVIINPKSEIMWKEYFSMELKYIEMVRKRREVLEWQNMKDDSEENDAVLRGDNVKIAYDKAVEEIQGIEFALSLLQLCLECEFTTKNVDHILKDVTQRFPDKEEVYDVLARQPLLRVQEKIAKGKSEGIKKKITVKKLHDKICAMYENAVQKLPTEKMWSFYLEFALSLLQSANDKKKAKFQDMIVGIMAKAAEADCLALEYYGQWADILNSKHEKDEAAFILVSAARKFNTVELWQNCLTQLIRRSVGDKAIYQILLEALSTLKDEDSLPIWKLGIDWLSFVDFEKLMQFYEMGCDKGTSVSLILKEMYLEAATFQYNVQAARNLYVKWKKAGSISLPIIRKVLSIEMGQLTLSVEHMKSLHEDAVRGFGSNNVDVWLEYISFTAQHAKQDVEAIRMIYYRAMETLQSELVEDFQSRAAGYYVAQNVTPKTERNF